MSHLNECIDTEQCPSCLSTYEIVALKFHLFRPASALMVCMRCGMVQSEINICAAGEAKLPRRARSKPARRPL